MIADDHAQKPEPRLGHQPHPPRPGRNGRRRVRASAPTAHGPTPPLASSPPADADWILIGEVVGIFGVHGELKIRPDTDFPERFATTPAVYTGPEHIRRPVMGARLTRNQVILQLEGITDASAAEQLRGAHLYVPAAEAIPLAADQYYLHDLIGLRAERPDGTPLGTIAAVYTGPANDLFAVREAGSGREVLVPAVKEMIKRVDVTAGVVVMEPIAGLFDEDGDSAD